jgi:type I restriction enzyme S subunit
MIATNKRSWESSMPCRRKTKALEAIYERKQSALAELKQSLLQKAFAGEL